MDLLGSAAVLSNPCFVSHADIVARPARRRLDGVANTDTFDSSFTASDLISTAIFSFLVHYRLFMSASTKASSASVSSSSYFCSVASLKPRIKSPAGVWLLKYFTLPQFVF